MYKFILSYLSIAHPSSIILTLFDNFISVIHLDGGSEAGDKAELEVPGCGEVRQATGGDREDHQLARVEAEEREGEITIQSEVADVVVLEECGRVVKDKKEDETVAAVQRGQ